MPGVGALGHYCVNGRITRAHVKRTILATFRLRKTVMSMHRLLSTVGVLSVAAVTACGAAPSSDEAAVGSATGAVTIQKAYTRKIYVHMMPWFQVGGTHWSMNSRNSATGVASWYSPMIGEYSSNDGNVIEYQLLMMKYAGIDGVIIDWPGLNGANDLPQNKANADAIIARTAEFGMEFSVCYEDQYGVSIDAAKNDMSYVRDQLFSKPNYIKVAGQPELLVFGPQKYTNPNDWTQILSVFSTKPTFFTLWYNMNAGSNAQGQFSWVTQNGLKGVSDFDDGSDGGGHGIQIPVIYPGFNAYYQQGGWPGPTWKVSYSLNQDNTDGGATGDTFGSSFELGKYAGDSLQIVTWNDYGEGTMIEPTNQFQYRFLTTLQQKVGTKYTDAELKIVKMLFDQRRATNGSQAAKLNMASQALANLDVATACSILGCTTPVHTGGTGAGGASGTAGAPAAGGSPASGGTTGASGAPSKGGSTGVGGAPVGSAGSVSASAGHTGVAGNAAVGAGAPGTAGAAADDDSGSSGGCSVSSASRPRSAAFLFAASALALASVRRRKRAMRA